MITFGLTKGGAEAEWFDTREEVESAHQKKPMKWEWVILIYGFARQLGSIRYNPHFGYYVTGNLDKDGVDLLQKYRVFSNEE